MWSETPARALHPSNGNARPHSHCHAALLPVAIALRRRAVTENQINGSLLLRHKCQHRSRQSRHGGCRCQRWARSGRKQRLPLSLCPSDSDASRTSGDSLNTAWLRRSASLKAILVRWALLESFESSQDARPAIGRSIALAARTGSKYSRRNTILPPAARRKTT